MFPSESSTQDQLEKQVYNDVSAERRTALTKNTIEIAESQESDLNMIELFFYKISQNPQIIQEENNEEVSDNIPNFLQLQDETDYLKVYRLRKSSIEKVIPILTTNASKNKLIDQNQAAMLFISFITTLFNTKKFLSSWGSKFPCLNFGNCFFRLITQHSKIASKYMCSIINFNPAVPYSQNSINFQKLCKLIKFSPSLAELNIDIPNQINCIRFTLIPIRFLTNYIPKNTKKDELKFPNTNLLGKICMLLFTSDGHFLWRSNIYKGCIGVIDLYNKIFESNDFFQKIKQFSPNEDKANIYCYELQSSSDLENKTNSIRLFCSNEIKNVESYKNSLYLPAIFIGLMELEIDAFRNANNHKSIINELIDSILIVSLFKFEHEFLKDKNENKYSLYEAAYKTLISIFYGNTKLEKSLKEIEKNNYDISNLQLLIGNEEDKSRKEEQLSELQKTLNECLAKSAIAKKIMIEEQENFDDLTNLVQTISNSALNNKNKLIDIEEKKNQILKWKSDETVGFKDKNKYTLIIFMPLIRRKIIVKNINIYTTLNQIINFLNTESEDVGVTKTFYCPFTFMEFDCSLPISYFVAKKEIKNSDCLYTFFARDEDPQRAQNLFFSHYQNKDQIYSYFEYEFPDMHDLTQTSEDTIE